MAKRYDPILCMFVDEPTKAQDGILFYQLRFSSGRTEGAKLDESEIRSYAEALLEKYGEKQVAVSRQGKIVATYLNRKANDSASALDEAITTADGMFSKAFGEYSKGAKFKKDKFLKELAGIEDTKEFASKMQTFDNELRKNLERLDEAYNVAGQDYYSARNEIRSIMDAFSKEAFGLYRKLDTK